MSGILIANERSELCRPFAAFGSGSFDVNDNSRSHGRNDGVCDLARQRRWQRVAVTAIELIAEPSRKQEPSCS